MKKTILSVLMSTAMFGAYSNAHAFGDILSKCDYMIAYNVLVFEVSMSCFGSSYAGLGPGDPDNLPNY